MLIRCFNIHGGYSTSGNIAADKCVLLSLPANSVPLGAKIIVEPNTPTYLPLSSHLISTLDFSIEDEKGKLYDFNGEEIFIKFHLKQV